MPDPSRPGRPSTPALSLYESHTRSLLFRGDLEQCKAAGIRISFKNRRVTFRGRPWVIVNQDLSRPGDECIWVSPTKEAV